MTYTTKKVAELTGFHLHSIYARMRREGGSFFGIKPHQQLNRRLVWPKGAVDSLIEQRERGNEC